MSEEDRFSRRTLLKLGVGAAAGASLVDAPSALAATADSGLPQVPRRRLGKSGK